MAWSPAAPDHGRLWEDVMRRIGRRIAWPMIFFLLAGVGTAGAQGDPEKGEKVFNKCKACHAVDEEKNKIGPHLVGIFGRPAGNVEGFKYSDAMKSSGIVWEDDTIAAYLKEPKAYIPGNRMAFVGLRKDDEIVDLLAYLHEEAGG
jgi:cytochrome c